MYCLVLGVQKYFYVFCLTVYHVPLGTDTQRVRCAIELIFRIFGESAYNIDIYSGQDGTRNLGHISS